MTELESAKESLNHYKKMTKSTEKLIKAYQDSVKRVLSQYETYANTMSLKELEQADKYLKLYQDGLDSNLRYHSKEKEWVSEAQNAVDRLTEK